MSDRRLIALALLPALAGCGLWIEPSDLCDTAVDRLRYYPDEDGDGYGAGGEGSCSPQAGYAELGGDCDDLDPTVNPAAAEICADALDQDCDGVVDESAAAPSCEPAAMETTQVGGVDIGYGADCTTWIGTAEAGAGRLVAVSSDGSEGGHIVGDDVTALALDPRSGDVIVASPGAALGVFAGDEVESTFAAAYAGDAPALGWTTDLLDRQPVSITVDAQGTVWIPGFTSADALGAVSADDWQATGVPLGIGALSGVALDTEGRLFVSSGAGVYAVEPERPDPALWFEAPAVILDMVFSASALYLSTADGDVWRFPHEGGRSLVAEGVGQGKLALDPAGGLVHLAPSPPSNVGVLTRWAICE